MYWKTSPSNRQQCTLYNDFFDKKIAELYFNKVEKRWIVLNSIISLRDVYSPVMNYFIEYSDKPTAIKKCVEEVIDIKTRQLFGYVKIYEDNLHNLVFSSEDNKIYITDGVNRSPAFYAESAHDGKVWVSPYYFIKDENLFKNGLKENYDEIGAYTLKISIPFEKEELIDIIKRYNNDERSEGKGKKLREGIYEQYILSCKYLNLRSKKA